MQFIMQLIGSALAIFFVIILPLLVILKGREIEENRGLPRGCGRFIIMSGFWAVILFLWLIADVILSLFR